MKLTAILLLAAFLQVSARGYSQRLSISEKNALLETVFKKIEKQTGYTFWYDYVMLKEAKRVNIEASNITLLEALELCFKGQSLSYTIVNRTIVVKSKEIVQAQDVPPITVRGTVKDARNQPLAGVTVTLKGRAVAATTDEDGNFSVNVPENVKSLEFSSIGYNTKEVAITGTTVSVTLEEKISGLQQVVVVGYGTQQRSNITGAVATVSSKSIENQSLASFDQAIAGQVAGVNVAQRTGTPGGGVSIRVRGSGSISAGNEPLYVIDGIPVEGGFNRDANPLAALNPNDIESIQILKDASSAAIYGSRGSNGVVIVTTKRGKSGKAKVQFDAYYGMQEVAKKIDLLNAQEYAEYSTEARNNGWVDQGGKVTDPNSARPARYQIPAMFLNTSSLGKGTDWQDQIFRKAPMQNYQVTASGGSDQSQFLFSAAYFNQEGVVINSGFKRYSFRVNLDTKISDRIKLGVTLAPSYSTNKIVFADDQVFAGGVIASALSMPPTTPVYNPDGTFTTQLGAAQFIGDIENPVALATRNKHNRTNFRTLGTVFGEVSIFKGLKFKTSIGADYNNSKQAIYRPSDVGRSGVRAPVIPDGSASSFEGLTWLNENLLTYDRIINNDHNISALAGYTSQKSHTYTSSISAINFPNDLVTTLNAGTVNAGSTFDTEWSLLSYLGRINYAFRNKYLFTATVRRDGSSRFGKNNKWGTFPSASVGWRVSEEKFLENSNLVSDLKLRASYGVAGNNTIGNYGSVGLLSSLDYVFGSNGGTVINGLRPSTLSNLDLGWEMMKQFDAGIEFGLFNNRLFFVAEYYDKITQDLLLNVSVPSSTGFTTALQNIGKVSNKGWEFSLNTKNLTGDFGWNTDFNITFNQNKVLTLGPAGDPIISRSSGFSPNTHITQIGQPLASFYGHKVIGIYQNQEDLAKSPKIEGNNGSRAGDLKFRDVNNDGKITATDVTIIGNSNPDFTYGFTNTFSYKNFNLSVLVDGAEGYELLNGSRRNIIAVSNVYPRRDVLGRWQSPENPGDGKTPRANINPTGSNNAFVSTLFVEDASFLRIRNINLRYQLPQNIFNTIPVQGASVYVSVQNAFTFTKYQGYNPEASFTAGNPLVPGVDFNGYPVARVYTLGVNVNFK